MKKKNKTKQNEKNQNKKMSILLQLLYQSEQIYDITTKKVFLNVSNPSFLDICLYFSTYTDF